MYYPQTSTDKHTFTPIYTALTKQTCAEYTHNTLACSSLKDLIILCSLKDLIILLEHYQAGPHFPFKIGPTPMALEWVGKTGYCCYDVLHSEPYPRMERMYVFLNMLKDFSRRDFTQLLSGG